MWRSFLIGKLAISIVVSLLVGGYGVWRTQSPDLSTSEFSSWLGLGVFFLLLGAVQIALAVMMFRKKKFD